jgi:hypothetical protein
MTLELGRSLMRAGLAPRALAAWSGCSTIAALPRHARALRDRPVVPASTALALFVAGRELAIDVAARQLALDELIAIGAVERSAAAVAARIAILPIAESLIVCDRIDAPDRDDVVAWPDDSSLHLLGSVAATPRSARSWIDRPDLRSWIDLGCGSAFAQLARPALAGELVALDHNPRAIELAALGAALSGVELQLRVADIADVGALGSATLVTCNAPIPGDTTRTTWRRADDGFFTRLWPAIRRALVPDPNACAVVHALAAAIPDELDGERVIARYADFAVLRWRPTARDRLVVRRRELTLARPHVDHEDLTDAP